MKSIYLWGVLGAAIIITVIIISQRVMVAPQAQTIKIGVLTDLTGPASAYWGESTKAGAELAAKDLKEKGYKVELVYEDYQLDASKAASAAQKLVSVDKVDAVYVEFNPGAIAAASVLKAKNIPMIYAAGITSPVDVSPNFFKTYLDYRVGCKEVAQKFKDSGVQKIGYLKMNLEFATRCLEGISDVYGNTFDVEGYNIGDTDFRTALLKIKNSGATAVMNVGFEGDTYNALKVLKDLNYKLTYGTVDDTMTPKVTAAYPEQVKGARTFGFTDVDPSFVERIKTNSGRTYPSYWGAALAYVHMTQLVESASKCNKEILCTTKHISDSKADSVSGFKGFTNRIADLEMVIKQY